LDVVLPGQPRCGVIRLCRIKQVLMHSNNAREYRVPKEIENQGIWRDRQRGTWAKGENDAILNYQSVKIAHRDADRGIDQRHIRKSDWICGVDAYELKNRWLQGRECRARRAKRTFKADEQREYNKATVQRPRLDHCQAQRE
jgi:hypothetical protein